MRDETGLGRPLIWIGPFPVSRNGISDYAVKIAKPWARVPSFRMLRLYFSNWQRDYPLQLTHVLGSLAAAAVRRPLPLVHIQYCPYSTGPGAAAVAAAARALGMRVVTTIHEDRTSGLADKSRLYRYIFPPFEDALVRLSDAFVVHCQAQLDRLPSDVQRRSRIIEFGAEACNRHVEPDAGPTVGCFGIIAPHKGIETAIEACEEASHDLPGLRLVIAGAVPDARRPREYFDWIRGIARQRLRDRVEVLANVDSTAFDDLYHRADALCFAVQRVNQSTTFYLALEHGKPIVASDVGGIGELVRREGLGGLAPPGNAKAMAREIVRLFRDDGARRGAESAVRRYVEGRPWSRNSEEHLQLYREVLRIGSSPEAQARARAA